MKVGIIVAMEAEREALSRSGVVAVLSGIGKVNAARAATELILSERPDCIINSGVAGSLCPEVCRGDVVIASQTAYHDVWFGEPNVPGQVEGLPIRFDADPKLLELALSLDYEVQRQVGLVCTGDQFFISLEEDARQKRMYPDALACDMESAAVAQVCAHYGVPFLSFRLISDTHGSAEEQAQGYGTFFEDAAKCSFDVLRQLINRI